MMNKEKHVAVKCPFCGSENIERGIQVDFTGGTSGKIGLISSKSIFAVAEPLAADLCRDCGSVVRFYITGSTDQPWRKIGEESDPDLRHEDGEGD